MLLPSECTDLLSAALRHVRDAEHLASHDSHRSLDQAFHLAGYGPECARKAALAIRSFDKLLGHLLTTAAEPIVETALALDPIAHRYRLDAWPVRYPALVRWREQARYERTGSRGRVEVEELIRAARVRADLDLHSRTLPLAGGDRLFLFSYPGAGGLCAPDYLTAKHLSGALHVFPASCRIRRRSETGQDPAVGSTGAHDWAPSFFLPRLSQQPPSTCGVW